MRKRICDLRLTPRQLFWVFMRYSITMKLSKCSMSAASLKIFILIPCPVRMTPAVSLWKPLVFFFVTSPAAWPDGYNVLYHKFVDCLSEFLVS